MKTTTMRTVGVIFSAGVLLTSCVSSKKYHASQAAVAKLQSDSAALAQQVSTLHNDVSSWQQKNSDLQKSLETANTSSASLQKNVAYYTDFASKQQSSTTAISDELKTTLAPAGLTDQDIMLTDGKIYINMGEKSLFKGNSTALSAKGKQLVSTLGDYVKSKETVDVSVADLELANDGGTTTTTEMTSSGTTGTSGTTTTSGTGSTGNDMANTSGSNRKNSNVSGNADYSNNSSASTKTAKRSVAVHHAKKAPAASGESKSVTYSSGKSNKYTAARSSRTAARALAWKRQNAVADALLKTGIPKVKLVSQLPGTGTPSANAQKGVQVILVNDMDNFYKHMSEAPAAAQPVSKNP
ncbi:MAG TPA: hypothetical protein VL307_08705 [Chitinophagaceae bacterium]|nr:hypothetical protein [Chitinophagaceae bacterium]